MSHNHNAPWVVQNKTIGQVQKLNKVFSGFRGGFAFRFPRISPETTEDMTSVCSDTMQISQNFRRPCRLVAKGLLFCHNEFSHMETKWGMGISHLKTLFAIKYLLLYVMTLCECQCQRFVNFPTVALWSPAGSINTKLYISVVVINVVWSLAHNPPQSPSAAPTHTRCCTQIAAPQTLTVAVILGCVRHSLTAQIILKRSCCGSLKCSTYRCWMLILPKCDCVSVVKFKFGIFFKNPFGLFSMILKKPLNYFGGNS